MQSKTETKQSMSGQQVFSDHLARAVINALSAHIAVLDENGVILETNRAWQDYSEKHGMPVAYDFRKASYLDVCHATEGEDAQCACKVAEGIQSVIDGELDHFQLDYPCHNEDNKRWFYLRVMRVSHEKPIRVVVSHEDISELKSVEEALSLQKQALEEANIALKVLLKRRENDKSDMEQTVLININNLVLPYVDKLKQLNPKPANKALIDIIERQLSDIVNPLLHNLANAKILLTPQEIHVSALIKEGKSSKEIAGILNVSEATVHFHRKNLRKKFGLHNTRVNLRSHILSLSQ